MTYFDYTWLLLAGVAAGFCNTIAGGGSMFVVPLMIFLGLPATTANASLRPAILVQNIFALLVFRRAGMLDSSFLKRVLPLILLSVPAAVIGARLVTTVMDDASLEQTIATIFFGLALFMAFWRPRTLATRHRYLALVLIAGAGFYGGFIQIGVGFLLITALLLGDKWVMAQAHAAKISIVGIYTLVSLPVFVVSGQINWVVAAALAIGQGVGGVLGSRFATRVKEEHLKRLYIVLMILFALILFIR